MPLNSSQISLVLKLLSQENSIAAGHLIFFVSAPGQGVHDPAKAFLLFFRTEPH